MKMLISILRLGVVETTIPYYHISVKDQHYYLSFPLIHKKNSIDLMAVLHIAAVYGDFAMESTFIQLTLVTC